MTAKGRALGMKETNYHNASGLPDPLQITTATDLALLARHLAYDFPQYFSYFSLPGFTYKGTYYPTHDNLIGRYQGADGIKTGYTGASGFNLVTSVVRGGNHVIGVVMGGRTAVRRDREMARLLDNTFTQIAANPTLVASRPVPWQAVAAAAAPPAMAGFSLTPQPRPSNRFTALAALHPPAPDNDDEDAAERRVAPDEASAALAHGMPHPAVPDTAALVADSHAPPAPAAVKPLMALAAAKQGPPPPAIRPTPRPQLQAPVLVASNAPVQPRPRPALRPDIAEGDADPTPVPGHNWTIQIGAYADQTFARAQLAAYAQKSQDVLGQAARIVTPAQGADGHTIYRARFGLYAEAQARDVCSRLSQRGQTCFAAVASR
jgi:D-alanyl-D-alanine carboxypeptidase